MSEGVDEERTENLEREPHGFLVEHLHRRSRADEDVDFSPGGLTAREAGTRILLRCWFEAETAAVREHLDIECERLHLRRRKLDVEVAPVAQRAPVFSARSDDLDGSDTVQVRLLGGWKKVLFSFCSSASTQKKDAGIASRRMSVRVPYEQPVE